MKALAEAAELLEQSKLVIKIQTFPFERASEAQSSRTATPAGSSSSFLDSA